MDTLADLIAIRDRIDREITGLQAERQQVEAAIAGIRKSAPQHNGTASSATPSLKGMRPTDACLHFIGTENWIAPSEVRDKLLAAGYSDWDKGRMLSIVYPTMKRLASQGVLLERQVGGRWVFRRSKRS